MKSLVLGIVLIILVGVGGFFYRSVLEHPQPGPGGQVACTMEAKVCPDGSSVGRQGPNCAFAACAFPNAEDASIGVAFVVPTGFTANADAIGADETLRAVFDKPGNDTNAPDSIVIRDYPIPAGKTANDVMLANTMYETSGNQPKSMSEFSSKAINGKTYRVIVVERFEAMVHSLYYLPRGADVLRFEVVERGVAGWTEPSLVIEKLPAHQALLQLLSTLQLSKQ